MDLLYHNKLMETAFQALLNGQQGEIEGLLNRLSAALKTKKEKLVFQINNYDIILTVLDVKLSVLFNCHVNNEKLL